MPAIVSDVVADVVGSVEKLRADDRLVTSPDQQMNELEVLLNAVTSMQAEITHRLREAHATDAAKEASGRTTKGWLHEEMFLQGVEASRYLRLVHMLRCFPDTEAAFDTAQITIAHVAAIITALESLPQHLWPTVEPHLVEHARFNPPEEIARFIDQLLVALNIDRVSEIRRERRHAQRGVDLHQTMDGVRSLNGTLSPDVGDAMARALALAAGRCGDDDDRTPRQRNHDALGDIANAYLAAHETPSFTGAPRTAIVTMDLETLEGQLRDAWIRLPDGAQIHAETARRLACDAEIIPVVLSSKGEVLDVGQANREFTTAQRRAAYLRQGGMCAFPGCCGKVVELHHIVFRRHGGPGVLDNAAWLCSFHHWLVHEGSWSLTRQADGSYLWTGPGGRQRVRRLSTTRQPMTA